MADDRTRYSDGELQEFKELINEKLIASKQQLTYLQEQIHKVTENPNSQLTGLDDGTSTLEKEYLNKMASRQIHYINHLENALIRISNKVYGICRKTGKLIRKERLRLVPHATLSIAAKEKDSYPRTRGSYLRRSRLS